MHSHCGCVKLTVVIICKQFITWEETWFKSCSTQKGRKIQMLPSSCFRWHSPLQNLCNMPLLWWATSKLHFKYKCITNVMCISDIDAYQYQYLKDKTHNNPPYQSIMSIQIRWYSPLNWRLCNISQLDELHQSSTSLRFQYLSITKCQQWCPPIHHPSRTTLKPNCVLKEADSEK